MDVGRRMNGLDFIKVCREEDVVSEIELEDCGSVGVETLRVHFGE